MQHADTLYPLVLIALGWLGYYLLNLNSSKRFLSKMGFDLLSALSFAFNMVGAFLCLSSLVS